MNFILHIETATEECSVALSANGKLLRELNAEEKLSHASSLQPLIDRLFKEENIGIESLSAVAVSMGPGSYTGLRIGLSTAKGLAYAINIPLIGVSTLRSAATSAKRSMDLVGNDIIMPVIDARRMEVYAMLFDNKMNILQEASAIIMDDESLNEIEAGRIIFVGNGAEKLKQLYKYREDCSFITNQVHLASNGIDEAWQKYNAQNFEDTAYCEPFYLKEFVPGKPKVKGLR